MRSNWRAIIANPTTLFIMGGNPVRAEETRHRLDHCTIVRKPLKLPNLRMGTRPTAPRDIVKVSKVSLKKTVSAQQIGGVCLAGPTPKFVRLDKFCYQLIGVLIMV